MNKTYRIISRFECCNTMMVTVIINGKSASVMSERDYNRIVETERKHRNGFY